MGDQHDAVGFVDATNRRKFDIDVYARRAKERLEKEEREAKGVKGPRARPVQRANLRARDFKVDLDSRIGKTRIIDSQRSANSGYYCDVCDCVIKDSVSFLDHINGRKHQRNLGMSMRVERSTANDVKQKLEDLKRRKELAANGESISYSLDDAEAKMMEEDERQKRAKRQERKERKRLKRESEQGFLRKHSSSHQRKIINESQHDTTTEHDTREEHSGSGYAGDKEESGAAFEQNPMTGRRAAMAAAAAVVSQSQHEIPDRQTTDEDSNHTDSNGTRLEAECEEIDPAIAAALGINSFV